MSNVQTANDSLEKMQNARVSIYFDVDDTLAIPD